MADSKMNIRDRKIKVVNLTRYLIDLYDPAKSFAYILLASILAGAIGFVALGSPLLTGILVGLWFLAIPALLAAVLTTAVSNAFGKLLILRRSAYLAFFATLIFSVLFVIGSFLPTKLYGVYDLLIFGLVLIFAMRLFILSVTAAYNRMLLLFLAGLHPFLVFAALIFFPVAAPFGVIAMKMGMASVIIAGLAGFFVMLIDAPMKRNFGITAIELANAFLSHWIDQTAEMERVLETISEKAQTLLGLIVFKSRKGINSVYIIPYVHPGPFGYVGGGKLTAILDNIPNAVVFHGTATHDLNPVTTKSVLELKQAVEEKLESLDFPFSKTASHSIKTHCGDVKLLGQKLGETVFLASTMSPKATEDIDMPIGLAERAVLRKTFAEAIPVDTHNCHLSGDHAIYAGNPAVFDLLDCAEKMEGRLKKEKEFRIKQGFAQDPLENYSLQDGVGPTGLKVSVLDIGGQKTAHIVFDANNMAAGLREKIIAAVKKLGIDEAEVFTTDSHCVNNIRGVENPIGKRIAHEALTGKAVNTVKRALQNMTEVEVGAIMSRIDDISVLGSQRSVELVSTINTMIGIMKIMAPLIFLSMLMFSLWSVLAIPW